MTLTMASKARHRSASQGEFPEGPIEFRKSPCAAAIRRVFRWPAIPGQSHHGRRRGLAHYADPELASERVTWSRAGCGGRYTNKIRTRSSLARSSKSVRFAVITMPAGRKSYQRIVLEFLPLAPIPLLGIPDPLDHHSSLPPILSNRSPLGFCQPA